MSSNNISNSSIEASTRAYTPIPVDRIVSIRKSVSGATAGQPWGDAIALARAIEKEAHSINGGAQAEIEKAKKVMHEAGIPMGDFLGMFNAFVSSHPHRPANMDAADSIPPDTDAEPLLHLTTKDIELLTNISSEQSNLMLMRAGYQRPEEAKLGVTGLMMLLQSLNEKADQSLAAGTTSVQSASLTCLQALFNEHAKLLETNAYTYFELAYTRHTGWMAWITDKPLTSGPVVSPDRKVLAQGQGDTPEEAAQNALTQGVLALMKARAA